MKGESGLRKSLLSVTLVPIIIFGIVILAYCSRQFAVTVYQEVENGLKDMAQVALYQYEQQFPGEYYLDGATSEVCKGGKKVQEAAESLEHMKKISGIDVTIFYKDIRIVTTIRDQENKPIIGTRALGMITKEVYEAGKEKFYPDTTINGEQYFSYYAPVHDGKGNCIGMIFAGKPSCYVEKIVLKAIIPIISIIVFAIGVIVFLIRHYAAGLSRVLRTMQHFLSKVEEGDFSETLGESITGRQDELGKIGKSAVQMQRSLKELVEKDSLTGLYNRHYGEVWMNQMIEESKERGIRYFVAIADVDFFKKFNDRYGHDCGDLVLQEVSRILETSVREYGYASRWGGEEFLLVFQVATMKEARICMEELGQRIRQHKIPYHGEELQVTITIGLVEGMRNQEMDEVIKEVDEALYEGKANGRDQVVCKWKGEELI